MKILITGATGYIGNRLALEAAGKGWIVHALVRDPFSKHIPSHKNIVLFKGDITDKASIEKAIAGCDKVIHSAAFTNEMDENNPGFHDVNVEGTRNILEAACMYNISRLVFTGSCSVFGPSGEQPVSESDEKFIDPTTQYAFTKLKAEELVKEFCAKGLWSVIVSPSRIYGPGNLTSGNPINKLILKVLKSRIALMPSDRKIKGNYVFIDDVVNGHFLALEKGQKGEKYIIGGENISYKYFFNTLRMLSGKKIFIVPVAKWLLKSWSWFYNALCYLAGTGTPISPKLIDRVWQNRALSCDKAVRQLGYRVTPFEEGMKKTIGHLKRSLSKETAKSINQCTSSDLQLQHHLKQS